MKSPPTPIVIASDHPIELVGIRKALDLAGGFEVVGEGHSGPEVVPLVSRTDAEVVLLNLEMVGLDGLECLARLRARNPRVRVVMLASKADPETLDAVFARGACGFILKNVGVADLGPSIHAALNGGANRQYGMPPITDALVASRAGLSAREVDILHAVGRGLSNAEIAHELWVSEPTVKFHLTNIYKKLHVLNRTAATRWALDHGISS